MADDDSGWVYPGLKPILKGGYKMRAMVDLQSLLSLTLDL
jgi:hypothetical protein